LVEKFWMVSPEDLVVADQGEHVVRRVERRSEQTDFLDRAGDAADGHEVAHLQRPQDDQEYPAGKVGQQAGPGQTDGDPGGSEEGCKGRGLNAEITQDADHQQDIQGDIDDRPEVAHQGCIDLLAPQRALHHSTHPVDQPATNDPESDRGKHLDAEFGSVLQRQVLPAQDVFLVHEFPL
jgi:hypothetical protein